MPAAWLTGVLINILGQCLINLGVNLMKLSHKHREKKPTVDLDALEQADVTVRTEDSLPAANGSRVPTNGTYKLLSDATLEAEKRAEAKNSYKHLHRIWYTGAVWS